jgi:phosphoenolpyruvate carboxykinase (ATP)
VFRIAVPAHCPGVPSEVLDARAQWVDHAAYDRSAQELARRFRENFKRFGSIADELAHAAPGAE